MCTQKNAPCRHERARERVLEILHKMEPGTQFILADLWRGNRFGPTPANYSMTYVTVREAVEAGLIERIGSYPSQGSPALYRKPPCAAVARESMQPPRGWKRPAGAA